MRPSFLTSSEQASHQTTQAIYFYQHPAGHTARDRCIYTQQRQTHIHTHTQAPLSSTAVFQKTRHIRDGINKRPKGRHTPSGFACSVLFTVQCTQASKIEVFGSQTSPTAVLLGRNNFLSCLVTHLMRCNPLKKYHDIFTNYHSPEKRYLEKLDTIRRLGVRP